VLALYWKVVVNDSKLPFKSLNERQSTTVRSERRITVAEGIYVFLEC